MKTFTAGIEIDPLNKLINSIFYYNMAIVSMKLFMKE